MVSGDPHRELPHIQVAHAAQANGAGQPDRLSIPAIGPLSSENGVVGGKDKEVFTMEGDCEIIVRPHDFAAQSSSNLRANADHRHPFYENLIDIRRTITADKWDRRRLGLVVPCYNEKDDAKHTLLSIREELPYLLKSKEIDVLHVFFIIDGSGKDQLETAQIAGEAMKELFVTQDKYTLREVGSENDKLQADVKVLLQYEAQIQALKKKIDQDDLTVFEQDDLEKQLKVVQNHKRELFLDGFAPHEKTFVDYPSRLLRYDFEYESTLKKKSKADGSTHVDQPSVQLPVQAQAHAQSVPSSAPVNHTSIMMESTAHTGRVVKLQITLLIKELNRQKRDTLLLCIHSCLMDETIPFALGFVDCDTNWIKGSLTDMRLYLGRNPTAAAVSGTIVLRNETWQNPITTLQDFNYLISQIATKEAENFFGMVTCCPGAFSMTKLEPATDPESVLPQITKHAVSVEGKNRIELGEDRFWTTLLLERGFDKDRPENTRVDYLRAAVAETDAPADLITYLLQQRRWINSTNANFAYGLIPKLNKFVFSCNKRIIGITYLWLRSFFEQVSSFLSAGITGLLMVAMFCDIGIPYIGSFVLSFTTLLSALLLVLIFPKPKENPFPYKLYIYASAIISGGLISVWFVLVIPSAIANFNKSTDHIRQILLFGFFIMTFLLTFIHGKLYRACTPLYKPFLYIPFIPLQNVLLPIYCYVNIADFSWGNRDTQPASTAAETAKSERTAKNFFFFFLLCNTLVFCLQFFDASISAAIFLVFEFVLLSTMLGTVAFSILAAIKIACYRIKYRFKSMKERYNENGAGGSTVNSLPASSSSQPVTNVAGTNVSRPSSTDGSSHPGLVLSNRLYHNRTEQVSKQVVSTQARISPPVMYGSAEGTTSAASAVTMPAPSAPVVAAPTIAPVRSRAAVNYVRPPGLTQPSAAGIQQQQHHVIG